MLMLSPWPLSARHLRAAAIIGGLHGTLAKWKNHRKHALAAGWTESAS
jgi:hypothetical protein